MNAKDLTDEQRAKLLAELERHRTYFFRLVERMKARQWYVDSAVLNAVEAAWKATSSAISAIRLEQDQKEREIKPGFVLPPPTRVDHTRGSDPTRSR